MEFEIIKTQIPFQDSQILAQVFGYNANNYKFRRMLKILIPRAVIKNPSKQFEAGGLPSVAEQGYAQKITPLLFQLNNLKTALLQRVRPTETSAFHSKLREPCGDLFAVGFPPLPNGSGPLGVPSSAGPMGMVRGATSKEQCSASLLFTGASEAKRQEQTPFYTCFIAPSGQHCLFNKREAIKLSSYLSGMNVKLAGRLMTQSLRPRFTVQTLQEGSLARVKVNFIEKSRFTGKNKRGAYSFTITISHVIN